MENAEQLKAVADVAFVTEQADLSDLQRLVWAALEDNEIVINGFDRLSDSDFGVEMRRGTRCFIEITLA